VNNVLPSGEARRSHEFRVRRLPGKAWAYFKLDASGDTSKQLQS